jgi:hypothetical protein
MNEAKKQSTIHKKNEFVRGTDMYSLLAKRAMNTIYWAYQKHGLYKYDKIPISFATLRKMMNLETNNDYVKDLKEALLELKQPLELNNFYHPISETTYSWYATSFVNDVGFRKDTDGQWIADIEVGNLIKYIMQQDGNFTPLNLILYVNKFRTKYAMKLYEYIKSFKGYYYIDITQKHMMKILDLDKKSKYRYMSDLTILIERQLNEIAKKSDLKYVKLTNQETLKKSKIFRVQIQEKRIKNG